MNEAELFHGGRVTLWRGDCLAEMAGLAADSIDACVTDPPYHLTSIVKRFGAENAAPCRPFKSNLVRDPDTLQPITGKQSQSQYGRLSTGFMGKQWDGGDIAFRSEVWREVYRVLKPGAHLLAFGGTRTSHRMICAIEDAGFEIRDCIQWLYGSGFPKSHDVSKGIDRNHHADKIGWFGKWLRQERATRGISQKELAERGGFFDKINHGGLVANWELGYGIPTAEDFNKVCKILAVDFPPIEEFKREVVGRRKVNAGVAFTSDGPTELDITVPSSDAARQWEGWGTALKPACEPIVLARKPLSEGTVAANVLKWGTGALNIDGCRVGIDEAERDVIDHRSGAGESTEGWGHIGNRAEGQRYKSNTSGRWPANVITDGSDEVVGAFPQTTSGTFNGHRNKPKTREVFGKFQLHDERGHHGDSGSASRFFYTAKADADDRLGSKHPTVKPLDLIQYLIRLVTPPHGTVLDPFAGTGTTGEAALREGMGAVLIEREAEYQADIVRRMGLVGASKAERKRVALAIKAAKDVQAVGPLFGAAA
jgi:DNA modification methylase